MIEVFFPHGKNPYAVNMVADSWSEANGIVFLFHRKTLVASFVVQPGTKLLDHKTMIETKLQPAIVRDALKDVKWDPLEPEEPEPQP